MSDLVFLYNYAKFLSRPLLAAPGGFRDWIQYSIFCAQIHTFVTNAQKSCNLRRAARGRVGPNFRSHYMAQNFLESGAYAHIAR
jgi:hypothetical protein